MVTVGELHEVVLCEITALYQIKREIPRKSKNMPAFSLPAILGLNADLTNSIAATIAYAFAVAYR